MHLSIHVRIIIIYYIIYKNINNITFVLIKMSKKQNLLDIKVRILNKRVTVKSA